jgi:hypothetical protein
MMQSSPPEVVMLVMQPPGVEKAQFGATAAE